MHKFNFGCIKPSKHSIFYFLFIMFCVFCSWDVNAVCRNNPNCQDFINDQAACVAAKGCYWTTLAGGGCADCPMGSYCPSGQQDAIRCVDTLGSDPYFYEPYDTTDSTNCDSQTDCYAIKNCITCDGNERDCIVIPNNPDPYLLYCGGVGDNYHVSTDWQHKCYANTVPCSVLGASSDGGTGAVVPNTYAYYRSGTGWVDDGHFWDVSECRWQGTVNNFTFTDDTGTHNTYCNASVVKKPKKATDISQTAQSGGTTYWYIHSVASNVGGVRYNELANYYCLACKTGYVPANTTLTPEYCAITMIPYHDIQLMKICSCEVAPKGYYSVQNCLWETIDVSGEPYVNFVVTMANCKQACPFGKTTDNAGSNSPEACHYGDETEFCDSKGCFTLGSLGNDWIEVP